MNSIGGQKAFAIAHASEVSAARRHGAALANTLGFSETEAGRLAIIVTEAATNMLKHAHDGVLLLSGARIGTANAVEVLALDRGPGIANLAQSLRDGISTTGTAGTGLGAMRRQADEFDAYSQPGKGSAFYLRVQAGSHDAPAAPLPLIEIGTVCQPIAGEDECGDAWAITLRDNAATVLVADGLGHGPDAATASNAAVHALDRHADLRPAALMQTLHQALRPTRGAAAAVADIRLGSGELHFAGIGNITACVIDGEARKQLVSHNGIVGHNMRKVQEFSLPWQHDSLCIMCSDGITTQWDLGVYPGLTSCHSALIAGVIFRDFCRGRDDATVVVVRQKAAG
jgi:anti-sigma regulatory factor (Ser/Thr protein kinase)